MRDSLQLRVAWRASPMSNTVTAAADAPVRLPRQEAEALLRQCFALYRDKLCEIARGSLEMASDLFEGNNFVTQDDDVKFKSKRAEWLARFGQNLDALYQRRMGGVKRKGRRPDFDASLASLRVLTAFDHEKQDALKSSTTFLMRLTRRELDALDVRLELLLPDADARDPDNPFGPAYILDAIGATSRAVYPEAKIWRPVMERLLADLTPAINKIYISLNRFLADRNVLPEIKAALRIRSDFRPEDDRDLIPAFSKLMSESGELPTNVIVPEILGDPAAPAFDFDHSARGAATAAGMLAPQAGAMVAPVSAPAIAPEIIRGLEALARIGKAEAHAAAKPEAAPGDLPSLDPLMALGSSTPLFDTLGYWQRLDLATALARVAPQAMPAASDVPLNLVPHIRTAIADQITNPADKITVDVIALLFDYIFRDPSIPQSLRTVFSRLQVPIVKVALLDRTFFSDKKHSARRFLDQLADAAIGAQNDEIYRDAFEHTATELVDEICRDFEIDVTAFDAAQARLGRFIDDERKASEAATEPDVAAALAAEESEADRSVARALVRDRLAGLDLPLEVRNFAETTWADHMGDIRARDGEASDAWKAAQATLDDLLWSIVAKERTGQKARLTKLIPTLIRGLRQGIAARALPDERAKAFLEELYGLHMAAIKPPPPPAEDAPAPPPMAASETHRVANVYDYVSEMVPGTWLAFRREADTINARLTWVSPLRTKYIFTSRSRRRAFVFSPEELAYELGSGRAALVVEPVPLFDRAVSAALDTLAGTRAPKDPEGPADALAPA